MRLGIRSQSLTNLLVDWVWCSGKYGITIPQQLLGVKPDSVVGRVTLEALNEVEVVLLGGVIVYVVIRYV